MLRETSFNYMEDEKLGKLLEQPKAIDPTKEKFNGYDGQSAGKGSLIESELGWLAGLWDGEGSITMFKHYEQGRRRQYIPVVCMTNTNPEIISHAIQLLDRSGIRLRVAILRKSDGVNSECYQILTTKQSVVKEFLEMLMPYLIGKKAQAELLLRFVSSRLNVLAGAKAMKFAKYDHETADKIESEIRLLNKKGPKPQRLNVELLNESRLVDDKVQTYAKA